MQDVGAGWLMTELSPSPLVVAMVQTATTLPVFLFALLAGAVADLIDRRILLLVLNLFLGAVSAIMAAFVHLQMMTPALLVGFTFLMGTGAAFMSPAWQAIVPGLVPRTELSSAIALNSMGINISRAIGPALAGVLIVSLGLTAPFVINALSVLGILLALVWWKPEQVPKARLAREHVAGAIAGGIRYTVNSLPLRSTLIRAAGFFLFASAYWAMLPLIARTQLDGGAPLYGILLASIGAGAVIGALLLPRIRSWLGSDLAVIGGSLGTAAVLLLFAMTSTPVIATAASLLAGFCWIVVLSTLNISAQTSLPDWVRARGLSIYLTVFFGSMSLGSLGWGQVASIAGIETALYLAAAGAVIFAFATAGAKLNLGEALDLSPSMHWPAPVPPDGNAEPDGPVQVQVEYVVPAENHSAFRQLMKSLRSARQRSGAYKWSLDQPEETPEYFTESWIEPSWTHHLRHHDRVSQSDRALQDQVAALLRPGTHPAVRHLWPEEGTVAP